jgi:hypothetical protein
MKGAVCAQKFQNRQLGVMIQIGIIVRVFIVWPVNRQIYVFILAH